MTSADVDSLRSHWITLACLLPLPPQASIGFSWEASEEECRKRKLVEEVERPDFGFLFASKLAECRRSGAVDRLGGRGHYKLIRQCFAVEPVRQAVEVLEGRGGREERSEEAGHLAVERAIELNADPPMRYLLQATLISRGATVDAVAEALDLDADSVATYADLFFNVIDRRNELLYIRGVADLLESGRDFQSEQPLSKEFAEGLREAFHLPLNQVLERGGFTGRGARSDEDSDAAVAHRVTGMNRQVLLASGRGSD